MIRSLCTCNMPGMLLCLLSFVLPSIPVSAQSQSFFFSPPLYPGAGVTATGDFNGDGKPDLVTADGTLLLGNWDGTFRLGTPLTVGNAILNSIAVADFNGDGKPDVLFTSSSDTNLHVFLGNGDGTFQSVLTNVGVTVSSFAVADVNGDGKPDVVSGIGPAIWVFLGNGDGTFGAGVQFSTNTLPTGLMLLGDFNGDGKEDVALAGPGSGNVAGNVGIMLGDGAGNFQAPVTSAGAVNPQELIAGDFNGDGKLDLLIGDFSSFGTILLAGNGNGTFQTPAMAAPQEGAVAARDLNGDQIIDLAIGTPPSVNIYLGNRNGSFTAKGSYLYGFYSTIAFQTTSWPSSILIEDLNGDGKPDLVAQGTVMLGNGDGTFSGNPFVQTSTVLVATPVSGVGGSTGDFNGDGKPDVIEFSQDAVYVLLGDGTGKFSVAHTYTLGSTIQALGAASLRNNGTSDLVVVTLDSSNNWILSVMQGAGDGSFGAPASYPQGVPFAQSGPALALADFNGDHFPDLAVLSNGQVEVFLGKGDGTFASGANYFAGSQAGSLSTADFNNDGHVDVAVASSAGLGILLGKGDGTLNPVTFASVQGLGALLTAADFNGDSNVDLIAGNLGLLILLGKGDGTFTVQSVFQGRATSGNSILAGSADFNGDGKLDLFAVQDSGYIWMVLGNGDGTFGAGPIYLGSGNISLALAADFNLDRRIDLAIGDGTDPFNRHATTTNGVATLLNVSAPGFQMSASAISPATVIAGSSGTSNISVVTIFGFNGAVALFCGNGLPTGVTCTFNPALVSNASGTSTLTITTSASVAAGSYPITVIATSGSLTETAVLSLAVKAPPGFAVSPTALTPAAVTAGGSATATITTSPTGGFGGSVTFSCSSIILNGSPATVAPPTCSFNPPSVTGAGSTTLTIATTGRTGLLLPSLQRETRWFVAMALPVFGIIIGMGFRVDRKKRLHFLLLPLILAGLMLAAGCGSGSHSITGGGTPAGSYSITVTASATGASSQNTTVSFTVQ
jgi:hypothetical protein